MNELFMLKEGVLRDKNKKEREAESKAAAQRIKNLVETAVATGLTFATGGAGLPALLSKIPALGKVIKGSKTLTSIAKFLNAAQKTSRAGVYGTNILNNLTNRSLILLDEIGRGTSTYDGLAIAWSVTEYLHNSKYSPITLFATHYHELIDLGNSLLKANNLSVDVKEYEGDIIFLRKIIQGGTNKSYGIHVAKMAGIPKKVLNRASKILNSLSSDAKSTKEIPIDDDKFDQEDFMSSEIIKKIKSINR